MANRKAIGNVAILIVTVVALAIVVGIFIGLRI